MRAQAISQVLAEPHAAPYSPDPMADGENKMEVIRFRVTPKQKEFLDRAAKKEKLTTSSWVRRLLFMEAERILGEQAPEL